jgi:hypothetical protein
VQAGLIEDVLMPSLWIIAAATVGAINVRLIAPGVAAFLGIWTPPERPSSS